MSALTNLLEETVQVLNQNGKTESDVLYVSSSYYDDSNNRYSSFLSWADFKFYASEIDFNSSYGSHHINLGLKIVGDGFWLERTEYDGSEDWVFKTLPAKPEAQIKILDPGVMAALLNDYSRGESEIKDHNKGDVKFNNLEAKLLSYEEKKDIEEQILPLKPPNQSSNKI